MVNEAFSDEALFRFTPQYEASLLPFRYEALRSRSVWWKNEKWELCLQTFLAHAIIYSTKRNALFPLWKDERWQIAIKKAPEGQTMHNHTWRSRRKLYPWQEKPPDTVARRSGVLSEKSKLFSFLSWFFFVFLLVPLLPDLTTAEVEFILFVLTAEVGFILLTLLRRFNNRRTQKVFKQGAF